MAYDLARLATRSRPWRTIQPTQSQGTTLFNTAYKPILNAWTASAAVMLANYDNPSAIEQEDADTQREVELLIALLLLRNFYTSLETWHRRKWLSSVSNAAGFSVDMLLERPTGALAPNRAARRAANRGLVSSARTAVQVQQATLVPSAALTGIDAVLANAVAVNVADVRSVSNAARARMANVIFNGIQGGRAAEDVARDVAKGLAGDRTKARKSAQDQVVRASKAVTRFRIEEAGFQDGAWEHLDGQLHPRLTHRARQGKVFGINDPVWSELQWPFCHCQMKPPPLLRPGRGNVG